jgi:hypothetical protein
MKKKYLHLAFIVTLGIIVATAWVSGCVDFAELLKQLADWCQSSGLLPSIVVILALFIVKGFILVPPHTIFCSTCCMLPLWIGIPTCLAGQMISLIISWHWGVASVAAKADAVERRIPRAWWKLAALAFLPVPSDVYLSGLRIGGLRSRFALSVLGPNVIVRTLVILLPGRAILDCF